MTPRTLCMVSLDHLIRSRQHVRQNREADLFCGFQIDDEVELLRLLHREIGGLSAFYNLIDKDRRSAIQIDKIHSITDQAAGFRELRTSDGGQPLFCYILHNLAVIGAEKIVLRECDGVNALLGYR
jgi:hypothetical protein